MNNYESLIVTLIKWFIILFIVSFVLFFLVQLRKYFYFRKLYGQKNAKNMFVKELKVKWLIPKRESQSYERTEELILNTGWNITVEKFYTLKYLLLFSVVFFGITITHTNIGLKIDEIYTDLNLGRSITEQKVLVDPQLIDYEKTLIEEVSLYLKNSNLTANNPVSQNLIEAYISNKDNDSENPNLLAKRILTKIEKLENLSKDYTVYVEIILFAIIAFLIPDVFIFLKLYLIEGKKDWEILHCMVSYSVTATLPPKTPTSVVKSMQDVSIIYHNLLEEFKIALSKGKVGEKEVQKIIDFVDNEDMQQVLETLVLANEIGVDATVDNIDDQLENKIEWMSVNASMRRDVKTTLSFVFVIIIFLRLFDYLMYYMNLVNNMMFIEF